MGRLSFTLHDRGRYREIDVRAQWHPRNAGLIYWLLMIRRTCLFFRGMALERIARPAEQITEK